MNLPDLQTKLTADHPELIGVEDITGESWTSGCLRLVFIVAGENVFLDVRVSPELAADEAVLAKYLSAEIAFLKAHPERNSRPA